MRILLVLTVAAFGLVASYGFVNAQATPPQQKSDTQFMSTESTQSQPTKAKRPAKKSKKSSRSAR